MSLKNSLWDGSRASSLEALLSALIVWKIDRTPRTLAAVFFQILLDFQRGHAACAGCGDGLAVAPILHIAAGIHAGNDHALVRGEHVALGQNVALGVEIDLAVECFGVGVVADAEEHA